jgi:hypothetical protein
MQVQGGTMRILLLSIGFIFLTASTYAKASEKRDKNFSIQDSTKAVKYWVI